MTINTALVVMSNISKAFGSTAALNNVNFEALPGCVHALMGENGAGKSTLMKILAGVVQPDTGTIQKNGKLVDFASPRAALDAGISTVFQELSLLPNLTVAENIFLGRESLTRSGQVNHRLMTQRARQLLTQIGLEVRPNRLIRNLSIAEKQFIEIARGISANADVIILDEPTAALNAADVELLNRQIRALQEKGKAIIYISHRMEEIFRLCDTVTVLKDGRLIDTVAIDKVTPKALISMMVGRDIAELFPPRPASHDTDVVLSVDRLELVQGDSPISINLRKGEIVGLAGLEGQGQRELVRALVGMYSPFKGSITVGRRSLKLPISPNGGVRRLQSLGLGFVPEDRKDEGLFLDQSVADNITVSVHGALSEMHIARPCRELVSRTMSDLSVKAAGPGVAVGTLSGGNQQKVLLGRYLALGSDILVIEEPTRGVDVGAKTEIYRLLRDFTRRGGAVLVVSREMLELIGLCDRLYIVHNRTIVDEMLASAATEHNILEAALHLR